MVFTGDLDSVDLAQVFQVLRANNKTGMLLVFRPDRRRAFHFAERGVSLQVDLPAYEDRVVDLLKRRGQVSEESVRISAANRDAQRNLLESLVAIRAADPAQVDAALRALLEEDLFDTFFWTGARFEFFEGARRVEDLQGVVDERFVFHPDSVVMEAARRIDEWAVIRARIPDRGEVFVPQVEGETPPAGTVEAEVFSFVDGCRSVEAILQVCPRTSFEVEKALAALAEAGWIAKLPPDLLLEVGRQALKAGRGAEAAALLERAAACGADPEGALADAALAHRTAESFVSAVGCLRRLADLKATRGATSDACGALREAVALIPTDLASRERLVTLALELPPRARNGFDPVVEGRAVASFLLDLEQPERARTVLEAVVAQVPKDAETKRLLVAALTRLGETSAVVAVYESLANDVAEGNPIGAVRYLQKILLLNRNRTDVAERIKQLYRSVERRRSRRRGALVATAAVFGVASLAGLYTLYEFTSRAAFEALDLDGRRLRGEFDEGIAAIETFIDRHPLSFAARGARGTLEDFRAALAREEAARAADESRRTAERNRLVARAEGLFRAAKEKAGEGKLRDAARDLRASLDAGPPDWKNAADVRGQIASIETYLRQGRELAERASLLEGEARYAEARAVWRELVTTRADAPEAAAVRLPFPVRTEPVGASVALDGSPVPGTTPLVVRTDPQRPATIEVSREGHLGARRVLEPGAEDPAVIVLGLAPVASSKLPGPVATPPILAGGALLAGLRGGKVVALEAIDGRPRWNASLAGFGEVSSVSTEGEDVYFTGTDGTVGCVRISDGHVRFRVRVGAKVSAPPAVTDDLVVVGVGNGAVVALERATGTERWRYEWGFAVALPVLAFPRGFVATGGDGMVRLLDPLGGRTLREWRVPPAPIGVARSADHLLVLGSEGRFVAIDPANPVVRWTGSPLGLVRHAPILGRSRLFVTAGEDLVAIDPETGESVGRRSLGFAPSFPPAYVGGSVLVAGARGRVDAYDEATLERRWTTTLDEDAQAFSEKGGAALVVTTQGTILEFADRATQPGDTGGR